MSDPTQRRGAEPHPSSAHRTPEEIAEDEAGPIGDQSREPHARPAADQGPVRKLDKRTVEEPGSTPSKRTT